MTEHAAETRRGLSFARVMGPYFLVLFVAFLGGVYLYFKHVAYQRVAARHLPADTRLALRCDVETMLVLEPLREHLLPLFELGAPTGAGLKPRHDRFRAHTGVELARDLREVVIGVARDQQAWVVVFGGKFPRTGMVDGLETVLAEEGALARREGPVLLLASGGAIGQALDGALIVASDPVRLRQALEGSDAFLSLGLPPEGAGGFAASLVGVAVPGLVGLEQVSGALSIDREIELDGALRFSGQQGRAAPAVADGIHGLARRIPLDAGFVRPVMDSAVQPRRPNELEIRTQVHPAELDSAARWLAGAVHAHFAGPKRPPSE